MTQNLENSTQTIDADALQRQMKEQAQRIDHLVVAMGNVRDKVGLLLVLENGFLDPSIVSRIGNERYRAILPVLRKRDSDTDDLVDEWMKQTNRFKPDLAIEIMCEVSNDRITDSSVAKALYGICTRAGIDMHRLVDTPLSKWGELATTGEEITLHTCSVFSTMMSKVPHFAVSEMLDDGLLPTLHEIPAAGYVKFEDGEQRQLNLLEYFAYFHAGNERNDTLIKLLDKDSTPVREGLADSIVTVVRHFHGKTGDATQTAVKIAAMINAGADLDRLAEGLQAVSAETEGERHNVFHLVCGGYSKELSGISGTRLEYLPAAVETLWRTIGADERGCHEFDINARNARGETPLHQAVRSEELGIVKQLLEGGADHTAKTPEGLTAVDLAREHSRDDVLPLLLSCAARDAVQSVVNRARPQP